MREDSISSLLQVPCAAAVDLSSTLVSRLTSVREIFLLH